VGRVPAPPSAPAFVFCPRSNLQQPRTNAQRYQETMCKTIIQKSAPQPCSNTQRNHVSMHSATTYPYSTQPRGFSQRKTQQR